MSLLAGVYSFAGSLSSHLEAVDTIRVSLSRRNDPIDTFQDHRFFLAKLDIGAFGDRAFRVGESVTAITGEPFLDPTAARPSRTEDLEQLGPELDRRNLSVLRRCQGSFSVCHYNPASGLFLLATDRVGVRAVYFHVGASAIFFSSNLRVLEAIRQVPKRADLRAMTESVALGYPLGNRTPFADLRVLRGGEVLRRHDGDHRIVSYFHLRDIAEAGLSREEMLDRAYETFLAAVACRSARSEQANSFLSGGLDTRATVAALVALGKTVDTLTYELPGSKDALFSRRLAAHLGTRHNARPFDITKAHREHLASSLGQISYPPGAEVRFPSLIFSGDGGFVVGFQAVTDRIIEAMRRGDLGAVAHYRARHWPPRRIFGSKVREVVANVVGEGIRAELMRARTRDPAWDFHAYVMDNNQRRHVHYLYESLDVDRIELLLPFFDGRLVELISSGKFEWFMYHRFSVDWLERFPGAVTSIPWQSYHGHVPCPLPEAQQGRNFDTLSARERFTRSGPRFRRCRASVLGASFPAKVLRRTPMMAAVFLHGLRIGNYGHLFDICAQYLDWLDRSRGEMVLTGTPAP